MRVTSNPTWRFAVECAELISGVAILLTGLITISKFLISINKIYISIPLFLILILMILLMSKRLKRLFSELYKEKVISQVEEEASLVEMSSPEEIIPKFNFVKRTFKFISKQAEQWSPHTQLISENLYIDVTSKGVDYSFQAFYKSSAKGLMRTFYIRSGLGEDFENYEDLPSFGEDASPPLCERYPHWREAAVTALDSIYESLSKAYKIAIHPHSDSLTMTIHYKQNKIDRKVRFAVDEKFIFNESSKIKIPIKRS